VDTCRYVLRRLALILFPVLLLALAFFLYPEMLLLPASQLVVIELLPLVTGLITLALCLRFNRSRMFFSVLTLVLSYVLLQWYLPTATATDAALVWSALCLLLPFNLVIFSLLRERGMLTWWGATRFAVLVIPFLLLFGLAQFYPAPVQTLLAWHITDVELLGGVQFPQVAVLMMLFAVLVLNGRLFARPAAQNSALFGALVAALVMLHLQQNSTASALFATAAILMLAVAVVQESWSMAYIDQLTSLPGRRALEEELLKLGGNYTIAMVDIDHFKRFNDRHGHDAGDQVLRMVAARIKEVGSGGRAFRYGGEEFTIVFAGKQREDTIAPLDSLRRRIAESRFQLRRKDRRLGKNNATRSGQKVKVTISIGVANRNDRHPVPHDVIKSADRALYRAKKQGRNRVCK
jgi:diguanylate cyclase (GGDEF)-like protein